MKSVPGLSEPCDMSLLDQIASLFRKSNSDAMNKARSSLPRSPRRKTEGFNCYLGTIVDMSSTGMKVHCASKPELSAGKHIELSIASPFQRVCVKARVAWARKLSDGWNLGLQFVDVGPGLSEVLDHIAQFGFAGVGEPGARRGRSVADDKEEVEKRHAEAKAGKAPSTQQPLQASVQCTDLYAILNVSPEVDEAGLRTAYRQSAMKVHPDVNKTPEANEQFAMISKAYAILSDAEKRAKYDELRNASRKHAA